MPSARARTHRGKFVACFYTRFAEKPHEAGVAASRATTFAPEPSSYGWFCSRGAPVPASPSRATRLNFKRDAFFGSLGDEPMSAVNDEVENRRRQEDGCPDDRRAII